MPPLLSLPLLLLPLCPPPLLLLLCLLLLATSSPPPSTGSGRLEVRARWIQPSSGRGSPDPAASNLIAVDQRLQFHHVHIVIISDADTAAATEDEIQSMKTVIVVAPTANTMGTPGAWWNREALVLPPSPSCMATESNLLRSWLTGSTGMDYKCYNLYRHRF
uniref:Uncharacterized protein n=1 Tax=Oryza glumipatula TaxID=40148 RepID=A0A0E0B2K9_9ORYZ